MCFIGQSLLTVTEYQRTCHCVVLIGWELGWGRFLEGDGECYEGSSSVYVCLSMSTKLFCFVVVTANSNLCSVTNTFKSHGVPVVR